jgi:hypothetical protein
MYIEDIFRSYWAHGLNNIVINNSGTFNEWIKEGKDYQIRNQVKEDEFTLDLYDRSLLLNPISKDCNRFCTASLESIIKVDNLDILPKSISWQLIKQYYSAFYSAHLILRFLGFSLSQFDSEGINKVKQIADLYQNLNHININGGYYLVDYSNNSKLVICKKINIKQDGGSHVALWKIFGEKIKFISIDSLTRNDSYEIQSFTKKLDDLINNLEYVGSSNYSWLSRIRNELNYKHLHGCWHPYSLKKNDLDYIIRNLGAWNGDIDKIELANLSGKEIIRFSNTCQYIIGLSKTISEDISKRCSSGNSFLNSGYSKIINYSFIQK